MLVEESLNHHKDAKQAKFSMPVWEISHRSTASHKSSQISKKQSTPKVRWVLYPIPLPILL